MSIRPRLWSICLAVVCVGCADEPEDTGDPSGGGSGEPSYPLPVFVDPASNNLIVASDRHEPISMRVDKIYPNNTALLVNDISVGTAVFEKPDLQLDEQELLFLPTGGLTPGLLNLQLLTRHDGDLLLSTPVELSIVPSETVQPVAAELGPEVVATGNMIAHAGTSESAAALLVREDSGSTSVVHVLFGWDPASSYALGLPGFESSRHPDTIGVAAGVLRPLSEEQPMVLQVAWPTGAAPDALVGRRLTAEPEPTLGPLVTLVDQEQFDDPAIEWFALGRSLVVGDTVVSEVYAPVDTESSHPGDHRLVSRAWNAQENSLGPLRHYYSNPLEDFDRLAPALDLIGLVGDAPGAVSVRRSGSTPALLVRGEERWALELGDPTAALGLASGAPAFVTTVRGALWSWQTWGVEQSGDIAVLVQRTLPGTPLQHVKAVAGGNEGVPDAVPTGEPSVALVAGTPRLLVPYGPETDVHALTVATNGMEISAQPLPGIRCDAIVAQQTLAGNLEAGEVVFACLNAGEVRLGTITVG